MSEIEPKDFTRGEDEVLQTKLTAPRLHAGHVPRPSLLDRLETGLSRKLILISAPAGFGKTALAAEWIAAAAPEGYKASARSERKPLPASKPSLSISGPASVQFAWVSLDEGDNDPARFWRYAITALRSFAPDLGKSALAALRTARQPSFDALLTTLINECAALPGRYALVLDDYHTITSPAVHETVTFLIDHLPENLHLVLITRGEPPLPIPRLRARDELVEIGAQELRFSPGEASRFFGQALGSPLAPETVADLQEQSGGWPAGLRFAALALAGRTRRKPSAWRNPFRATTRMSAITWPAK